MNKDTTNEIKNPEEKTAPETPKMTKEEMKKFISILGNSEEIQGNYVFNGFLVFFESISATIKKNPVDAQNLMLHLQQHVFNNLMWESFYAFDAHRNNAYSIFSTSEPHIYDEETPEPEKENDSDAAKVAADFQPLDVVSKQVSDLLNNPNTPKPIYGALSAGINDTYNELSDQSEFEQNSNSPEFVKKVLRNYLEENGND
jgi:hypothetical protein